MFVSGLEKKFKKAIRDPVLMRKLVRKVCITLPHPFSDPYSQLQVTKWNECGTQYRHQQTEGQLEVTPHE